MDAPTLRNKYLSFFRHKQHNIIPSSSLIPLHDSSVLFTTAGMQPLVPYLLGQKHPQGTRLVNIQKCLRTVDIDNIGDNTHHTFFEMLGNWSLGDYFKKEAITWSWEFLTSPNWLSINPHMLAVTVFGGNRTVPKDTETAKLWLDLGVPPSRIAYCGEDNFWSAGDTGPCGPSTEIFFWTGSPLPPPKAFDPEDQRWVEIWNNVFMYYTRDSDGTLHDLTIKNIDTGMGLERELSILTGCRSAYETELFLPIINELETLSSRSYISSLREMRIIADHLRAAVFILGDEAGIEPSNVERGYILRRLIRRSIRFAKLIGIDKPFTARIAEIVIGIYGQHYDELVKNRLRIYTQMQKEEDRFSESLDRGLREFHRLVELKTPSFALAHQKSAPPSSKTPASSTPHVKIKAPAPSPVKAKTHHKTPPQTSTKTTSQTPLKTPSTADSPAKFPVKNSPPARISAQEAFLLYQSYGFPIEMTSELAGEVGLEVDTAGFQAELAWHQQLSRSATEGMFKGGLSELSNKTVRLHTATHLLGEALRRMIGPDIHQRGSNITPDRLRFDFNFSRKLTPAEIKKVEDEVNRVIGLGLKVGCQQMELNAALQSGAEKEFAVKYPPRVTVYTIDGYSRELCGGPHVKNSRELGRFIIQKEEACAAGIRRIKATLIND